MEQQEAPPVDVAILIESQEIRANVVRILTELGWGYQIFGIQDVERTSQRDWDLVIISVPRVVEDGTALVRVFSYRPDVRIVMISDDPDPQHIAAVLESGADDYIQTPFDADELSARFSALINRTRSLADRHGRPVSFIYPMRTITIGPMHITFAPREWDVLIALLDAEGRQLSPRELAMTVWGDADQESTAISTVSRVRNRLKSGQFHGVSVHTHRGRGYSASVLRPIERRDSQSAEEGEATRSEQ